MQPEQGDQEPRTISAISTFLEYLQRRGTKESEAWNEEIGVILIVRQVFDGFLDGLDLLAGS